MLNLNSVMLGSAQPEELATFYQKVFAKKPDYVEDRWFGFQVGSCFLTIGFHDQVKAQAAEPARFIFNLETKDLAAEFNRLKGLGAKVVKEPYAMDGGNQPQIATFADPDGNYFQLMVPWEQDAKE